MGLPKKERVPREPQSIGASRNKIKYIKRGEIRYKFFIFF